MNKKTSREIVEDLLDIDLEDMFGGDAETLGDDLDEELEEHDGTKKI